MAISKSAKLVLTLVDQVSGPARAIQNALGGVNRAVRGAATVAMAPTRAVAAGARQMRRASGDVAVAGTAMAFGLTKAGQAIYNMEDTLNEIVGRRFGKEATIQLANGMEMTKEQFRKSVTDLVTTIDKESPRNAAEIAKAYSQLVQAGMSHEQVEAILPTAVQFAIAGNYDTEEAADRLTNVMTSMGMEMATLETAQASAKRAADVLAYAANITNSDIQQMTEAFKYAAPSAAALGISIEQLAGMFVIQARRGIKASEAGVSIRAMFTRMIRPTKMAAAALAQYGIDLADYQEKSKEVAASDVMTALSVGGLDASSAEAEINKVLESSGKTAEKVQQITEAVRKAVGDSSTMSADVISDVVREVLYSYGTNLDVERLIEDMQNANISPADFFRIFDVRQGARTLSLFSDDVSRWIEQIQERSEGFTDALSAERMQGLVGAVHRLDSALFGLFRAAADSGVLDTASNAIEKLASSINKLAKTNPEMLEIGTYAIMAAAALAPLGFAISGLAAVAGLLINPLAWVAAGVGYLAYLNFDNIMTWAKNFGPALQESLGPRTRNALEKAKTLMGEIFKTHDFDAAAAGKAHGKGFAGFIESEVVAMEHNIQQFQDLWGRMKGGWINFEAWWDNLVSQFHTGLNNYLTRSAEGFVRMKNDLIAQGQQLYEAGVAMIQSFWDGAVRKFEEFMGWVRGIPGRIRSAIGSITLDNVISFATGGNEPVAVPNIQGSNDNLPARAKGGPVNRGLSYVVGERGPELFTPNRNGNIVPNHKLGGGGGTTINMPVTINLNGGATREDGARVAAEIERRLSRSQDISFSGAFSYGD